MAIGASRNGGQELTLQNIHAAMMIHDMILISDGCNTSHFGGTVWNVGEDKEDENGLKTIRSLAKRMAETMKLLNH